MRTLFAISVVSALAGCSEPTGAPQSWPPPLGVAIETVLAGDLDGDGISEIVAYSSGDNAGAYLIEGSPSLAAGTPPTHFTRFVSEPFASNIAGAMFVEDNAGQIVAAYADSGSIAIEQYDAHLEPPVLPLPTEVPAGGTVLWVAPSPRINGSFDLLVGNGSEVHYISGLDATETTLQTNLPAPVVVGATFYVGGVRKVAVANATDAEVATLNTDGTIGLWTQIRSGAAWVGQTAFDLDGDGQPELLALDATTNQLCALSLLAATSSCVATGDDARTGEVTIVPGKLTGGAAPDIAIVQSSGGAAEVGLVQDVSFDGVTLMGTGKGSIVSPTPLIGVHAVAITRGPGHHDSLVLVERSGALSCSFCD